MTSEKLAEFLLSGLPQLEVTQVTQLERDGNIVINIHTSTGASKLPFKSLAIHLVSDTPEMRDDLQLLGESDGYVDHEEYSRNTPAAITPADDKDL